MNERDATRATILKQMLLQQNLKARNPEEVPRYLDDERKPKTIELQGKRVGRNDPCPCGSGKKVKRCHKHIYTEEFVNVRAADPRQ